MKDWVARLRPCSWAWICVWGMREVIDVHRVGGIIWGGLDEDDDEDEEDEDDEDEDEDEDEDGEEDRGDGENIGV